MREKLNSAMTGLQTGDKLKKSENQENPPQGTMEERRGSKKSYILTAVVACVVTCVVLTTVVVSLYYGTRMCNSSPDTATPKTQVYAFQISDSPAAAKVDVQKAERVIITETDVTDERLDHTVTLQDYNRELQAVMDLNRKECYVFPVFYDFDDAVKLSENTTEIQPDEEAMELDATRTKEPIPSEVLQHAVGEHIAEFCSEVPTYWLIQTESEEMARVKRRIRIRIGIRFRIWKIRVSIGVEININK